MTANAKWSCTVWSRHANLPDFSNLICLLFQFKCPPFAYGMNGHIFWRTILQYCLASSILASCPGILSSKTKQNQQQQQKNDQKVRPPYNLLQTGCSKANIMSFDWWIDWMIDWLIDSLMDGLCDPVLHSMRLVRGGVARCSPAPLPCCLTNLFYRLFKKRGKPRGAKTERAGASG